MNTWINPQQQVMQVSLLKSAYFLLQNLIKSLFDRACKLNNSILTFGSMSNKLNVFLGCLVKPCRQIESWMLLQLTTVDRTRIFLRQDQIKVNFWCFLPLSQNSYFLFYIILVSIIRTLHLNVSSNLKLLNSISLA